MRWIVTLTLAAASFLSQAVPPPSQATGSVSGRVIDADTRMPLAGAQVGSSTLGWTQTNTEGRYTIPGLASGRTISIGVNFDGGGNIDDIPAIPKDVTVAAGRDTSGVDFKVRLDGSISGRVFDSHNEPLPGITVTVFSQAYSSDPYGFTSSD